MQNHVRGGSSGICLGEPSASPLFHEHQDAPQQACVTLQHIGRRMIQTDMLVVILGFSSNFSSEFRAKRRLSAGAQVASKLSDM